MPTEQPLNHHSVRPEVGANEIWFSHSSHISLCPKTVSLLWQRHSGGRKKILKHFHYLNLLQRRLINYTRSHQLSFSFLCTPPCLLPCCLIILCSPSIIIILWSSSCGPCVQSNKNCCKYISRTYYILIILILGWMGEHSLQQKSAA